MIFSGVAEEKRRRRIAIAFSIQLLLMQQYSGGRETIEGMDWCVAIELI
jgi:hypothetical protein